MATEQSSVREGIEIDTANLTTTLTELLGEMQNLTEEQRVGESKRQKLEIQLERLDRAIQWGEPEIAPVKEQSIDAGNESRESKRCEKYRRGGCR